MNSISLRTKCSNSISKLLTFSPNASESTRRLVNKDLFLQPDYLSREKEQLLLDKAFFLLKRTKFESNHFDNVITGYREMNWTAMAMGMEKGGPLKDKAERFIKEKVLEDISRYCSMLNSARHHHNQNDTTLIDEKEKENSDKGSENKESDCNALKWLPPHILHLSSKGFIGPHVDNKDVRRFS